MILQFGAGNFLRAFVDLFLAELGRGPGSVIVVQSTGCERADAINAAGGRYHVAIQGFHQGGVVDEVAAVDSLSHALHAGTQWPEIRVLGRQRDLEAIVSNTTEAGLSLDEADRAHESGSEAAPVSFPAKLLEVLRVRFESGLPGISVIPCELIENNGDRLRELALEQAKVWELSPDFRGWLERECDWINSLVDRIVPGRPVAHPLRDEDPLLVSAEPYAFWGIERPTGGSGFPLEHPAIVSTEDLRPFTLRKVRLLNGAHSALVSKGAEFRLATVRECVEHPQVGAWLEALLFEEIVPVVEGRCEDPEGFARTTLERFRNPFLEHQLSAIALNHETKVAVRLRPTLEEFRERFGREPKRLASVFD